MYVLRKKSRCSFLCLQCPDICLLFTVHSTHANPFRRHIGQMNILESIEQVTLRCCVCSCTSVVHTLHLSYTFAVNTVQYSVVPCDIFMILGHRDRQKTVIKVVFRSNESYRMILFRYVTSHLQETIQAEGKHFSQLKLMANQTQQTVKQLCNSLSSV